MTPAPLLAIALDVLAFVGGFALLVGGAEGLVHGGASLAKRLGISTSMIGATVVAVGTSTPELVVGVEAARTGHTDVVIGAVLGSNILNILLVLGITLLIARVTVSPRALKVDLPIQLGLVLLLFAVAFTGSFGLLLGIPLVLGVPAYVMVMRHRSMHDGIDPAPGNLPTWLSVALTIGGIALLVAGGTLVVRSGTGIATALGVSERIIALFLVAAGTSAPELAASVAAARRGDVGMAMGNITASNFLNIIMVLGISMLVRPLPVSDSVLWLDLPALMVTVLLLYVLLMLPQRRSVGWKSGILLLATYVVYTALVLIFK